MTLGEKILQARQEAGLSQRQLCGETITRNMLSQIEHGTARPSMDTLQYLAARLGKSVSFFLDEEDTVLPNWPLIRRARLCYAREDGAGVLDALKKYAGPDEIFDPEYRRLYFWAYMALAQQALAEGKKPYARQLMEQAGNPVGEAELRRWLLLRSRAGEDPAKLASQLPSIDEELRLRGLAALACGEVDRAAALLDSVENTDARCALLRGRVYLQQRMWQRARNCLEQAICDRPAEAAPLLEQCCKELGDYKAAYEYACMQKSEN